MQYSQNEVQVLLEALFCCLCDVVNAPRNPRAWRGSKATLRTVRSCGLTMERLRDDTELFEEDLGNLINAYALLCDENLFLPDEIEVAYILSAKLDGIRSRFEMLALE